MAQTYENYYKEYNKNRCKRINLVLNNEKDADIIDAIDGKNISMTIKELIREGLKSKQECYN